MEKEKFYEDLECFKIQHLMTDPGETANYSVPSRGGPEGYIEIRGKQNQLFPGGSAFK